MNLKDGLTNISNAIKQECKVINTQAPVMLSLTVFLIIGLLIACWWWHQDYIAIKSRYEHYIQAQEVYFQKAGKYPYTIWQSFNEEIGEGILHPDTAVQFRSEDY